MRSGRQSAVSGAGNANAGGITPTTSVRDLSMSMIRPTTPGSAPNRERHSASLSTATGGASGCASAAVKTRPRRGGVRNTSKNDGVTCAADTRCGSSGSVRLTDCPSYADTASRVRLSST